MSLQPVIFFDSGVGGLPYLRLARARLPQERFIYVADRLHYPYGDKAQDEIQRNVIESFSLIMERFSPKTAVIACNTASVAALASLRARFPIPFIGVVPAVKPAATLTKNGRIGILATPQTVKNDYLNGLIDDFAGGCQVLRVPAVRLRDLVEERYFSATAEEKRDVVNEAVNAIKKADVDVVVLACTHFLHMEKELAEALGRHITIIDSRDGVINQLIRILKGNKLSAKRNNGSGEFFLTGRAPWEERYRQFARLFQLEVGGTLS